MTESENDISEGKLNILDEEKVNKEFLEIYK
jgi:hypothetical protein